MKVVFGIIYFIPSLILLMGQFVASLVCALNWVITGRESFGAFLLAVITFPFIFLWEFPSMFWDVLSSTIDMAMAELKGGPTS